MSRDRRAVLKALSLAAALSLVLAACGSNKRESTGSGLPTKTVKIALIAPLSGSLSALGLGMKNSVDLAVNQANRDRKVRGWKVVFDPEDDTATANVGAQVAAKVASDAEVVAVVGTLNSSVAQQVQPILDRANITMISPANTGVALTGRDNLAAQRRPYHSYFRVATTDDIQGPFAADYLVKTAGKRNIAVIHDKKTYGQGLALAFKGQVVRDGGRVATTETINPGDKDFSAVLAKIKPLNPDAVYYGGEYPEAAPLSEQAKQLGMRIPLMGGDGIYDPTYIRNAPDSEGDLATSVGAPAEQLSSARKFIDTYRAAGYSDPFSAYGAYAFDAANVIVNALAKVLPGKSAITDAVRQDIIKAVQGTRMSGVTGDVSFDSFGDTTNKVLTVYKVTGGAWKPEKTDTFK
jgi:branched-chain amino acid transport system substrate-binding protein